MAPVLAAGDDQALLPKTNLTGIKTVPSHVLDPSLAAGGVLGNYQDPKGAYQLMLVRLATNEKAAFLLLDVKHLMTDAHYLAHMGGFAGKKNGQPFYAFAKGPFLAVVQGKPEAQADTLARIFAARLPLR
jgi:hypothetical protein